MQEQITGVVNEVVGRQVSTGTIFDVTIGTQKVSTFKDAVANKAQSLKGQTVKATLDVKENGKYKNYTLLDVEAEGATTNGAIQFQTNTGTASNSVPVTEDKRQESIVRQSSAKSAFAYAAAAGMDEQSAFLLAENIYRWCQGEARITQSEKQVVEDALALAGGDDIKW